MKAKLLGKAKKSRCTILIVGEGYAEIAFLEHLKRVLHARESGFVVKFTNARGKGAAQVVEYAIRQRRQTAYDQVAVVFDTDTDWTEAVRGSATTQGLLLFPSVPCLEAELLRLHVKEVMGSTAQIKRQFFERFGADALHIDYARHFPGHILCMSDRKLSIFTGLAAFMRDGC